MTENQSAQRWVNEVARMSRPDEVVWCDGSEAEHERLLETAVRVGDLIPLDQRALPGCFLHRSAPTDVARTEHLTFICSREQTDAGPTNNWMAPAEAYDRLSRIFAGAMQGRTMYVIPFLMGPPGSPFTKVGIQVTDSVYVVLNMRIMTRMGKAALEHLGDSDDFTRGLHGKADLNLERRFICHFPEDNTIWSVGSGYGGNALLSKKCLALRIASRLGSREGWLAEHMLIVGVESPDGEIHYVCGAFPSACGKTNLAMLVPPGVPASCGHGRASAVAGGGRHSKAELRQFPLNPLIAPPRILASQRENQRPRCLAKGWSARPTAGTAGPLPSGELAVPAEHGLGRSGSSPQRGRAGRSTATEVGQRADGAPEVGGEGPRFPGP
jgi:GTP-dependent phosphoenolpyruvate carboxykinase